MSGKTNKRHKMKTKIITVVMSGVIALVSGCSNVRVNAKPKAPSVSSKHDIVVEAASTREGMNVGSHYWKAEPSHLYAFPSDNTVFDRKQITTHSPGVEYLVRFKQPGTYYLWVKGKGEAGGASVIPGLDGIPLAENADFMGFFPGEFSWIGGLHDSGKRTELRIDTASKHRVNFWMLEDGFRFQKFMITADSNLIPE
jgi:hypothetical protein